MDDRITLRDVKLIFRNFSGNPDQYNAEGKRSFCVLLTTEQAEQFKKDGWNVKYLKGRMEGEEPQGYLQIAVSFDVYPPKVTMVTGSNLVELNADTVGTLDWAEIEKSDLTFRAYNWQMPNGTSGKKAYLKTLYATIQEDPLADAYKDIPRDSEPQMRAAKAVLDEEGA